MRRVSRTRPDHTCGFSRCANASGGIRGSLVCKCCNGQRVETVCCRCQGFTCNKYVQICNETLLTARLHDGDGDDNSDDLLRQMFKTFENGPKKICSFFHLHSHACAGSRDVDLTVSGSFVRLGGNTVILTAYGLPALSCKTTKLLLVQQMWLRTLRAEAARHVGDWQRLLGRSCR